MSELALDDHHRHPFGVHLVESVVDVGRRRWGEPEREFISDQHLRTERQGLHEAELALLASRQAPRCSAPGDTEGRKSVVGVVEDCANL